MGAAAMRKSWCTVWVGLGLALCLAGCQGLFPRPVYSPPVAPVPQAPPPPPQVVRPTFYVNGNNVRLRACFGFDCPIIASMNRNEEVEKMGDSDNWFQIRVKRDGTLGWVNSRYLSATPVAATPEVRAAAHPARSGDTAAAAGNAGKGQADPVEPPGGGKTPQNGQARGSYPASRKEKAGRGSAHQTGQAGQTAGRRRPGAGEAGKAGQTGKAPGPRDAGGEAHSSGKTGAAGRTRAGKARQDPDYVGR